MPWFRDKVQGSFYEELKYSRNKGRDVQRNNLKSGAVLGEMLKPTLGPKGRYKLLLPEWEFMKVTSDGMTILNGLSIKHPGSQMLSEAARVHYKEVGDGVTTVAILAGELCNRAIKLVDMGIHPTKVINGYRKAARKTLELLNNLAIPVDISDRETMLKLTQTTLCRTNGVAGTRLANYAYDAAMDAMEVRDGKKTVDRTMIQIAKKVGGGLNDSRKFNGILVDRSVVNSGMPKRVEKARIAIINCNLDIEQLKTPRQSPVKGTELRISSPSQMTSFVKQEIDIMKWQADCIKNAGANVLFTDRGVEFKQAFFLARNGIMGVMRVDGLHWIARATGGKIISDLRDIQPSDLGYADLVEERIIGTFSPAGPPEKVVFIEGCKNPRSSCILLRGTSEKFLEEESNAVYHAMATVQNIATKNKIVGGGGSVEVEIAKCLREYSLTVEGREQIAIQNFADALEAIPKTMIENSGLDSRTLVPDIRAAHDKPDGRWTGFDASCGGLRDMHAQGVIEPVLVKEQAIKTATEGVNQILRVDEILAGTRKVRMLPHTLPKDYTGEEDIDFVKKRTEKQAMVVPTQHLE